MEGLSAEALKRLQEAAARKGLGADAITNQASKLGIPTTVSPVAKPTTAVDQNVGVRPEGISDASASLYGFGRAIPKVATPENPAVPMGTNTITYDENNPTDYIYRMQAKKLAGKVMSEEEQYNYLKAVAKSNDIKSMTDPYADSQYGKELLAQQAAAKLAETSSDATALEAYKTQKNLENEAKIKLLEQQGQKQQEAAQRVLSFSGFGRSTAAATQMSDIQSNTNQAIQMANAARDAEIAKYKAELEGADGDTLKSLNSQIQEYNKAAQTRQLESIKKTAEANQKNTVSFEDALKNLGETSNAAGIDIGDTKDLAYYGSMVRNADGTVNEAKLATLPENVQALIRLAAQTSSATEAPKIENIGTTKNPRYVQWNGKERIPVAGGYTAGGGGSGGGKGTGKVSYGGITSVNSELDNILAASAKSKKMIPATQSVMLSDANYFPTMLADLSSTINSAKDKMGPVQGRLSGLNPYDTDAQNLQSKTTTAAQLVGKFMEGGVLRAEDTAKYQKMLPQMSDTPDVALNKLNNVKIMLNNKYNGYLRDFANTGYNVSKFSSAKVEDTNTIPEYKEGATYKSGDKIKRSGKTYKMGTDGNFYLSN